MEINKFVSKCMAELKLCDTSWCLIKALKTGATVASVNGLCAFNVDFVSVDNGFNIVPLCILVSCNPFWS